MTDLPVSFVVPAYNEEALIRSCLASIMAEISRTGCRAEIIVVNNASTDGTRGIASSIPGVVVIDEPQRGLVPARRAGCLAANGRLIANIDADTMLPEGWLRTALSEFARSPDLVALSGPFIHYDMSRSVRLVVAGFYRIAFISYLLVRYVARTGSMMQGGNFIVSKAALHAANAFNSDFHFYGEDTELARCLSKIGSVKFTFALPAFSSGRRLAGEGVLRVGVLYAINFLWTIFFKRPFSQTWLDFRHTPSASGARTVVPADLIRAQPPRA
jgi:glycosyltransferase involved in cell wall biosynthesis